MISLDSPVLSPLPASAVTAPRDGAELIRASRDFEAENRWTSWRLLLETLLVLGVGLWLVFHFTWWPMQLVAGILVGLVQVRLFIFFHDALHGAIFRGDAIGQGLMTLVGFYLLTMRSVWQETHDHHHQNNARQMGSIIGTYPVVSVDMLKQMTPAARIGYRITRHGLTMLAGCLSIVLGGLVTAAFIRKPKRHWFAPVAVLIQAGGFFALGSMCDWMTAVCALAIPLAVSSGIGAYLFYVQHNFPTLKLKPRGEWSYSSAALESSSMFDMSPMMHWITGSIGYHHVHHLNHRIPFYRLREAMMAIPELQNPGRTSWKLRDIRAALALYVWDPQQNRMLTHAEVR